VATQWATAARDRLRDSGQRIGAARATVIDSLDAQSCCRGAQEIHDALGTVGLASVYRVLDALFEQGLGQRVDVGDGVARFEAVRDDGHGHHHHLVCDDCGRVDPFFDPALEQALEGAASRLDYGMRAHEIVLHGSCADCRGGGA